jgi:UDP-N-acetylmuramate--alanine ligase
VHFVGIGGIGMSGIAEVLATLGYSVSGSDARRSDVTDRLISLGVRVDEGHDPAHVGDADVVVMSSAIRRENAEVAEARRRHVPVIPRAEMLAELMRLKTGIAIAGAHGKTTTTSMVALVLERGGLDPTAVIGGRLSAFGSNARLGRGEYMVAEADESDRSFLELSPTIAVVTNIDCEHMDAYGSFDRMVDAYIEFAGKVPFYGAVVACADDPSVNAMLRQISRRSITYGFAEAAHVRGEGVESDGRSGRCRVRFDIRGVPGGAGSGEIELQVPGQHNLQNALAAVAVGLELGVPFGLIQEALAAFQGLERRFQRRGAAAGITLVDDYAHHPAELRAALQAARGGAPARLVAVFQPHRYTRTRDLLEEFGPALSVADVVVLTDIYAAGEEPIAGITLDRLAEAVRRDVSEVHLVPEFADVPGFVAGLARPGDLVMTLGAGSIGTVGDQVLEAIRRRSGSVAEEDR